VGSKNLSLLFFFVLAKTEISIVKAKEECPLQAGTGQKNPYSGKNLNEKITIRKTGLQILEDK